MMKNITIQGSTNQKFILRFAVLHKKILNVLLLHRAVPIKSSFFVSLCPLWKKILNVFDFFYSGDFFRFPLGILKGSGRSTTYQKYSMSELIFFSTLRIDKYISKKKIDKFYHIPVYKKHWKLKQKKAFTLGIILSPHDIFHYSNRKK